MKKILQFTLPAICAVLCTAAPMSHADPQFNGPPAFGPHTFNIHCECGESINAVLPFVHPGSTLLLSGTCKENVILSSNVGQFNGLTIDGQGSAVISGPVATSNVLELDGIQNLMLQNLTITGGYDGVSVNTSSRVGMNHLTVQNVGRHGVHFQRMSQGYIVNSNVSNNPQNGIICNENSYCRIGETDGVGATEGATGACTINNNGNFGVRVQRQSSIRLYVSSIDNNGSDGIHVESMSYAEIADDDISGNVGNGIFVSENGDIHLGNKNGNSPEDIPNSTSTPNGTFGIAAQYNAYVSGHIGTLNGVSGPTSFTHGANNNLTP